MKFKVGDKVKHAKESGTIIMVDHHNGHNLYLFRPNGDLTGGFWTLEASLEISEED